MTKKASTPALRFKGFTYTWEQRKLSEFADKVTEKNVGLQYIETFTNSAEFGIISQRDFFDHDIAKMSSLGGYYIVRSEDFIRFLDHMILAQLILNIFSRASIGIHL